MQQEGFEVTYLPVEKSGVIDLKMLEEAIRPETVLVSTMAVNNEIGSIQPLKQIGNFCSSPYTRCGHKRHSSGALCRKNGVFFHTDASAALGKIKLDVNEMNIDLMSITAHKLYGPKGIGALYVRRRPRVRLDALMSGGGQERGMRSGTLPAPLVVGFGEACKIAREEIDVSVVERLKIPSVMIPLRRDL
jgi:cysteine desulfurase